jgi:hypothetical protein
MAIQIGPCDDEESVLGGGEECMLYSGWHNVVLAMWKVLFKLKW